MAVAAIKIETEIEMKLAVWETTEKNKIHFVSDGAVVVDVPLRQYKIDRVLKAHSIVTTLQAKKRFDRIIITMLS